MRLALAVALGIAALSNAASAQTFPERPIRMIIGLPSGATDSSARLIAGDMARRLGQPIVVESIVGASGTLAAQAVVKAKPDGYTVYYGSTIGISPVFNGANAVTADTQLTPISNLALTPYVLMVSGRLPVRSLAELVEYSKTNPGKLNHGAPPGGSAMLLSELLKSRAGIDSTYIPYAGSGPVMNAMLAGDVAWAVGAPGGWAGHYRSGAVRPLFVTSAKRMPSLPNVPTSVEAGQNITAGSSFGLWGPRGVQREVVMRLNEAAVATINSPEIADRLRSEAIGIEPIGSTPEERLRNYQEEFKLLSDGARLVNFKP